MRKLEPIKISHFEYQAPTDPQHERGIISPKQKAHRSSHKKFIPIKSEVVAADAQTFNKFTYENHRKYPFLNPFEPKRSNTILNIPKTERSPFGLRKNIEMVYCRNKIEDFQEFINAKLDTLEETKPAKKKATSLKRLSIPVTSRVHQEEERRRNFRVTKGKSTLLNIMKEYSELLKISGILNPEETSLFHNISLEAVQRRYPFLKQLDSLVLRRVLQALEVDSSLPKVEIPLKQFVTMSSILILRDASPSQIAFFLEKLFFEDEPLQFASVDKILSRLEGLSPKHARIKQTLSEFFSKGEGVFRKWCERHVQMMNSVVDLIIGTN